MLWASTGIEEVPGVYFQPPLEQTFKTTDTRLFKDMTPVQREGKTPLFLMCPFNKNLATETGDLITKEFKNFVKRRNATPDIKESLRKGAGYFGDAGVALFNARDVLGYPDAKIAMKIYKGVKAITGVAYYID
jgi:hypothetical protein